jgi:chorismate dehydratase
MQKVRLGVVSFLNTVPLIDGLEMIEGISLVPKVPSALIGCLESGEVDLALASSIDYQRSSETLRIMKVGLLSSDGQTLTVRLCSRVPIADVQEVHCDVDSHTSLALLQIVMKDMYRKDITIVPTEIRDLGKNNNDWPESVLMIGDKVVTSANESEYDYELDLGEAWKKETGLPFVFAVWMGKSNIAPEILELASMSLARQLKRNLQCLEQVVSSSATVRGWNPIEALRYVSGTMQYNWSDRHIESLELFFNRAHEIGIIPHARKIQYFDCNM